MTRNHLALALLVVTVWGANFTVITLGLAGVPPLVLAALRYLLVVFPAVLLVPRPVVAARYWVAYGFFVGACQFGCLFVAMHIGMPAGLASVVLQAQAFFTLLLAALFLRERLARRQVSGLCIATAGLCGIAVAADPGGATAVRPVAFGLAVAAAAFWGVSNIIVRRSVAAAASQDRRLDIVSLIVWSSLVPPLPLLLLAFAVDSPRTVYLALTGLNGVSIFAVLYLAFGATLFGYGVWSRLLAIYPAGRVAPLSLLVPVTGLLTAMVVLGERLSAMQWTGCAAVIAGLAVSSLERPLARRR
jgi:O-acetylserine/cysteine efflux transporter